MKMTPELKEKLTVAVAEVAELVADEQEFEAIEKAKAVCDTLKEFDQDQEVEEVRQRLAEVADGFIQGGEVMSDDLRTELEFTIVEIARLVEEEHEFEAIEKAKAVCDTLRTLRQGKDVEEVRARLVEAADFLMEDEHPLAA